MSFSSSADVPTTGDSCKTLSPCAQRGLRSSHAPSMNHLERLSRQLAGCSALGSPFLRQRSRPRLQVVRSTAQLLALLWFLPATLLALLLSLDVTVYSADAVRLIVFSRLNASRFYLHRTQMNLRLALDALLFQTMVVNTLLVARLALNLGLYTRPMPANVVLSGLACSTSVFIDAAHFQRDVSVRIYESRSHGSQYPLLCPDSRIRLTHTYRLMVPFAHIK